jgi:hypothetical protein
MLIARVGLVVRQVVTKEALEMCRMEIKVMHEGTDVETKEFKQARSLLAKAERIYFMGVGFNNLNMERLGVMNLKDGVASATGVNLDGKEHGDLLKQFGRKLTIRQHVNCLELVRSYVEWD